MHEECLIYPHVKQGVARAATLARYALTVVLVLSLAELVLYPFFVFGRMAQVAQAAAFLLLAAVAAWSHLCLLAQRGLSFTRYAMVLLIFFAGVMLLGTLWQLLTGEPLLENQDVLPLLLGTVACCIVWMNLPYAVAAPRALLWRVGLLPLFFLFSLILDIPGPMLLPALLMKALTLGVAYRPLKLLAQTAPLVVGLPPRDGS